MAFLSFTALDNTLQRWLICAGVIFAVRTILGLARRGLKGRLGRWLGRLPGKYDDAIVATVAETPDWSLWGVAMYAGNLALKLPEEVAHGVNVAAITLALVQTGLWSQRFLRSPRAQSISSEARTPVPQDLASNEQTGGAIAARKLRRTRSEAGGERPYLAFAMILGTLGLCASFVADGVRTLQTERASPLSDAGESDRQEAAHRRPSARQIGASILTRNIFDSQTGSLAWEDAPEPAQAPPDAPSPTAQPPSPCEGSDLRLIASVVNAVRPEHSFAALSKDRRTHLLGIGGQLDDVTLLALRPAFAYVQSGSAPPCVLPVFLPRSQRPKLQPETPKVIHVDTREPAARRKSLFSKQEVAAAVRPLGNGRYAVSKAFLTRALRNPSGAARGARLRPVERYGRTIGWELARLRKDALLAQMGLQKGDLLRSVNGHELSDAGGLLVALRMLQQADSVTLAIMRGSTAQNIQYTLE